MDPKMLSLLPDVIAALFAGFAARPDTRCAGQTATDDQTTAIAGQQPGMEAGREPEWEGQWRTLKYL